MPDISDQWAAGSTYEDFMGRWSRLLAPLFVAWLGIPDRQHWLDVGCGTGAMTDAILSLAEPATVVGCDPASTFLDYARTHTPDARATFIVASADGLPGRVGGYRSVTSLLALNFFPDPAAAVREMRSLTAPQGAVSACVWDYAGGMEFLRLFWDVATSLDATARDHDEGRRFPLCHPAALVALFRAGGLDDVRCEPIEVTTTFASFDDYWRPLLGGVGPAPSYVASLEPERRALLARQLEPALQPGPSGAISLSARAWAVRGTVN